MTALGSQHFLAAFKALLVCFLRQHGTAQHSTSLVDSHTSSFKSD